MATEIRLPKARVVAGNPTDWQPVKDDNGNQKMDKNGNPLHSNWVYLAIPKQDFLNQVWPAMVAEAAKVYHNAPNVHPDQYENDGFAWKIINGDSNFPPKKKPNSTPYNQREGYAGNYIVKLTTYAFLPDTVVYQNGAYRKIDAGQIKTGDYVVASVQIDTRADKNGMGLYWNPSIYELVELGTHIASEGGKDPNALLGDASSRSHGGFQGQLPTVGAPVIHQAPPAAFAGANMGVTMPQLPPAAPQPMLGNGYMPQAMPGNVAPAAPMGNLPAGPAGYQQQAAMNGAVGVPTAYPSNPPQLPPPAHDFVQNAMGYAAPQAQPMGNGAAPAGYPPVNAIPQGYGTAPSATTYPSNMPQLPPAR